MTKRAESTTRYGLRGEPIGQDAPDDVTVRRGLRKLELRRSPRFPIDLWVTVDGVESSARKRRGDISAHGIAFDTDTQLGDVGSVQWLRLESVNRAHRFEVMAHVVRTVGFGAPERFGVALEFMPESEERMAAIHHFVRKVISEVDPSPPVTPIDGGRGVGSIVTFPPKAGNLSFRTRWRLPPGDVVQVEVSAPGVPLPIRLSGTVLHVREAEGDSPQYQIDVALTQDRDGPLRRLSSTSLAAVSPDPEHRSPLESVPDADLSRSVDELLTSATSLRPTDLVTRSSHLSGILTAGRLPMLAALFEMEGISGELELSREHERATVFVRLGRIVDVDTTPIAVGAPRAALARVFEWGEGFFEFSIREVTRPDRIDASTTALLIDFARLADEQRRTRS